MKVYSPDSILSKWKEFVSHLESCYGAVRIEEDEMFMVEFWFQENRKVPRGFSDGDFVKNVYVSLDDFMGEKYVGFSYTYYSTVIGGSAYELTMETKVGEREVGFVIEIVQNENGYGIYHLDIET